MCYSCFVLCYGSKNVVVVCTKFNRILFIKSSCRDFYCVLWITQEHLLAKISYPRIVIFQTICNSLKSHFPKPKNLYSRHFNLHLLLYCFSYLLTHPLRILPNPFPKYITQILNRSHLVSISLGTLMIVY